MTRLAGSDIAGKIMIMIARNLNARISKGYETYGQTLDDCPDDAYDWQQMQIEELLDGLQYALKENAILRKKLSAEIKENLNLKRLLERGMKE